MYKTRVQLLPLRNNLPFAITRYNSQHFVNISEVLRKSSAQQFLIFHLEQTMTARWSIRKCFFCRGTVRLSGFFRRSRDAFSSRPPTRALARPSWCPLITGLAQRRGNQSGNSVETGIRGPFCSWEAVAVADRQAGDRKWQAPNPLCGSPASGKLNERQHSIKFITAEI